jgi:membrane protein implicated in regulation of membrane protease activity
MLEGIFAELGPWNWMVLGFALLALEILVPGVFLLWIGLAALIVGAVSLVMWDAGFWVWQVQVLAFLALALGCAFAGNKFMGGRRPDSDQPLLNRRAEQFVGRVVTLAEPIRDGRGRLQLDDTVWRISGPDLPAGARVRVAKVASSELELIVEAA